MYLEPLGTVRGQNLREFKVVTFTNNEFYVVITTVGKSTSIFVMVMESALKYQGAFDC